MKLISGVYKIEDVTTGSVYVGTADKDNGILKRWSNHKTKLKNSEHEYEELQEAFDADTNRIKWEILEDHSNLEFESDDEENEYLDERENYFIRYCDMIDGWTVINRNKNSKRKGKVKDKSKMIEAQTGDNNGHCTKLSSKKVFEILDMLKDGVNREIIADKFDVSAKYIYRIGKDRWVRAYNEWLKEKSYCVQINNSK